MKVTTSLLGSVFAFLLATTCCWLPWLAVIVGGSFFGVTAVSAKLEVFSGPLMAVSAGMLGYAGYSFWKKSRRKIVPRMVILQSQITCPACGFSKIETMPTDACQFFYECENCQTLLKPKQGDCCVFCSYGSVACPPIQEGKDCCA